MNDLFQSWALRKGDGTTWTLREPRRVVAEHRRALGARAEYAGVVISAMRSESFVFQSKANWPSDIYDDWVLEAALDVLLCSGPIHATGVTLTLDEIRWHEIDSCAVAFYWAARSAVTEIAGLSKHGYLTNFERQAAER